MKRTLTKPWYACRITSRGVPIADTQQWLPVGTELTEVRVLSSGVDWRARVNGVLWEADEGGGMPACDPPIDLASPPRPRPSGRGQSVPESQRATTRIQFRVDDRTRGALALQQRKGESPSQCAQRLLQSTLDRLTPT